MRCEGAQGHVHRHAVGTPGLSVCRLLHHAGNRHCGAAGDAMNRLERVGDAIDVCLPLVALAVSALVLWGCL